MSKEGLYYKKEFGFSNIIVIFSGFQVLGNVYAGYGYPTYFS